MGRRQAETPDRIGLGVALILASVAAMAFADAVVKLVSADLTLWQIFVARSLFAAPCLLLLRRLTSGSSAFLVDRWILARSALLVLTWLAFYASLPSLKLSVAAVAVYTNPILTALLSALVLGERVSRRQWLGVAIGFLGVAAILRPGLDAFSWWVLLPLGAAALYSGAMVLTRAKCRDVAAVDLALSLHSGFIIAGLAAILVLSLIDLGPDAIAVAPFLLDRWPAMGAADWALMAFLGVLSAAFFLGVARAYQIAPPQIIGVYDYAYLVSAAVWGFVFFRESPDALTIAGMALITIAGILVAARGRRGIWRAELRRKRERRIGMHRSSGARRRRL